jgi:hypothetical protein
MSRSLSLGFLTELPAGVKTAWGCVTPFWGRRLADPFEQEQATMTDDDEDLKALRQWLTTVGLTKLERRLQAEGIGKGSKEYAQVESRQFALIGGPQGSESTMALTAWKLPAPARKGTFSAKLNATTRSAEERG